jgi:hypothetical protein
LVDQSVCLALDYDDLPRAVGELSRLLEGAA